jgi:hypothetical protein
MKNSKTPGDDGIQMKLISNLPVNGFNILLQILQNTWTKNQVPVEWIKTIQIPIPKIKKNLKQLTISDEYHFAAPDTRSIQYGCSSSQKTCSMNFHPNKQDSSKTDPVMIIYSPITHPKTSPKFKYPRTKAWTTMSYLA